MGDWRGAERQRIAVPGPAGGGPGRRHEPAGGGPGPGAGGRPGCRPFAWRRDVVKRRGWHAPAWPVRVDDCHRQLRRTWASCAGTGGRTRAT
ncbi:hypothetical protein F6I44_02295 [Corynebacterium amycolatum]|nr:hypothetical protein F6I44_02295 [Corynebacterium amycolatum]